MLHVQPSSRNIWQVVATFGNTVDVLTRRGNPLGLGIRVIIFKVGIGGLREILKCPYVPSLIDRIE